MDDEVQRKARQVGIAAVKAGIKGKVEAEMSGNPKRAMAAAAFDFFAEVTGIVAEGWSSATERWWKATVAAIPGDPEAAREKAREKLNSEPGRKTVMASLRFLLDYIDPVAQPSVDALVAEYLVAERAPDVFFRGTARILCDCDATRFSDIRAIIAGAANGAIEGELIAMHNDDGTVRYSGGARDVDGSSWGSSTPLMAKQALFMLEANGFIDERAVWGATNKAFFIKGAMALRLARVLGGDSSTGG